MSTFCFQTLDLILLWSGRLKNYLLSEIFSPYKYSYIVNKSSLMFFFDKLNKLSFASPAAKEDGRMHCVSRTT